MGGDRRSIRRRSTRALVAIVASLLVLAGAVATAPTASAASTRVVAPWGDDRATGVPGAPWRTVQHALEQLRAGDTLVVRGGTYRERVKLYSGVMHQGRPDAPIRVEAAAGERPVIQGVLWLEDADHWIVDGLSVTWDPHTGRDHEHMVKFIDGTGWRLTNSELWGAQSYAALLVEQDADGFRIDHNRIHDTAATNGANQDHLIYVNNGHGGSGVIEHNRLWGAPNGRGVKLGPGSLSRPGTNGITIRANTIVDTRGPSNIQLSGSSSGNTIVGNILVSPRRGYANVTSWNLSGRDNVVRENLGWDSDGIVDRVAGLVDGGGNVRFDPSLDTALVPRRTDARRYGHLAGSDPVQQARLEALVAALYVDFLGRTGSPAEIDAHVDRLNAGVPVRTIIEGFAGSDEWAGALIDSYYRSTLGRSADPAGKANWLRMLRSGWSPARIAAAFYASDEYHRRSGGTPRAWITDLYQEILGRRPDPAGLASWERQLRIGRSRTWVAAAFHGSPESRQKRVSALYHALLGRGPDPTGLRTWTNVLADGHDIRLAATLASSAEYANRAVTRAG